MDHLPVFLDLRGRLVLVVGGGPVAARKIATLRRAGARIRLVAPQLCTVLQELVAAEPIEYLSAQFAAAHLDGSALAVAATGLPTVNHAVREAAERRGIWVNAVDDPESSNCLLPAIIDRSPILIAVGTSGRAPSLARRVRALIEAAVPQRIGELATLAGRWRRRAQEALPDVGVRRHFWDRFFSGPAAQRLLAGDTAGVDVDAQLQQLLMQYATSAAPAGGEVWLIGAGPGDPDLLTLRAQQLLQECDVVLYDRLVSSAVLERVRRDAERIFVGKESGHHQITQARINELLIDYARRGLRVARLKGGDPLIFGRAGEELVALAQAGIPVVIVAGVTAALGGAAIAGIPLTWRGVAQSVIWVTAMGEAAEQLDWRALAAPLQTVIFYMGVAQLPRIVSRLTEHGAPPQRSAALIENATLPQQRTVRATLATLEARAEEAKVQAPALLIVGDVVNVAPVRN
ncbi:MAG TPA: siroheme synthase CysG [Steroidobacteraceae bacterium]